jgi:PA14 domain
MSSQVHSDGRPFEAVWTGNLEAPVTGVYSMTLFAQGAVDLKIDGNSVIHADQPSDQPHAAEVELSAGQHTVEVHFSSENGPAGIEWTWSPPNREKSIVPPAALTPPATGGIGSEVPWEALGQESQQPADPPLETVP